MAPGAAGVHQKRTEETATRSRRWNTGRPGFPPTVSARRRPCWICGCWCPAARHAAATLLDEPAESGAERQLIGDVNLTQTTTCQVELCQKSTLLPNSDTPCREPGTHELVDIPAFPLRALSLSSMRFYSRVPLFRCPLRRTCDFPKLFTTQSQHSSPHSGAYRSACRVNFYNPKQSRGTDV